MGGTSELPEWGLSAVTQPLPYRGKQAEVRQMHRESHTNQQRQTEDADLETGARQAATSQGMSGPPEAGSTRNGFSLEPPEGESTALPLLVGEHTPVTEGRKSGVICYLGHRKPTKQGAAIWTNVVTEPFGKNGAREGQWACP